MKVEVVLPKRKFREIEEEESEDGEGEGQQVVVEEEQEQEEEEGEEESEYHEPPCGRCKRGARPCQKRPNGGACVTCRTNKYKCEYSKKEKEGNEGGKGKQGGKKEKEKEENEERKGKQGGKKKMEPEVKAKPEVKREAKASRTKPVAKAGPSTKKAKSREFIELSDEGESGQGEEPKPKPKPKRARVRTYADQEGELKNWSICCDLQRFVGSYGLPIGTPGGTGGRADAQHASVQPGG